MAVAANQLCLVGDMRFKSEACLFKERALQGVQRAIFANTLDYGTITTVLMLCFYDVCTYQAFSPFLLLCTKLLTASSAKISDGCDSSWVTHLHGGLNLIDSIQTCQYSSLRSFVTMYFVAHDIMNRTASEGQYRPDDTKITRNSWLDSDDLDEIDMLMGCSRQLMNLIDRISALAAEKRTIIQFIGNGIDPTEMADLLEQYVDASNELETSLHLLKQKLPAERYHNDSDRNSAACSTDHPIKRIAETKRLAALLYLRERLDLDEIGGMSSISIKNNNSSPIICGNQSPNPASAIEPDQAPSILPPGAATRQPSKRRLVLSIIDIISTLPDSPTLLWPLFILGNTGLEDSEDDRRFVLDRLDRIQKTRNLGSVRRTRLAVQRAFWKRDLNVDHNPAYGTGGRVWGDERSRVISLA